MAIAAPATAHRPAGGARAARGRGGGRRRADVWAARHPASRLTSARPRTCEWPQTCEWLAHERAAEAYGLLPDPSAGVGGLRRNLSWSS
uniref:hypothetical protein n=1 Tax=Nonomuraea gerenzanensis TaxID=93944 RepID=UPI00287F7FAE|nr:hypothetical protein [Nonomuraea gerenzanensis]